MMVKKAQYQVYPDLQEYLLKETRDY